MMLRIAVGCFVLGFVGAAAAKDLPRRQDEEPNRAKGCEYLGPGFVKAPGSDTCIKVGGSVRVEGSSTLNR